MSCCLQTKSLACNFFPSMEEPLGSSKLDEKQEEIQKLLKLNVSKSSIAKITGVDRSTLYHFLQSRKISAANG